MDNLLENKICLITGAAKGIGRAIAERFALDGAVVYANDLNTGALEEWIIPFNKNNNSKIYPLCFDVCDFSAVKDAILKIRSEQGKLDVLANNAGIVTYEYLNFIDFDKMRKMFDVNVVAIVHLMQMASKLMMRQKSGSIINMASIVGLKGAKGQLAYSATKGALISVTKSAAKELSQYNIRVNAVAPGMVATERFLHEIDGRFEDKLENVGMGRYANPSEIADAFSFLASDRSKYITGQVLAVDGDFLV